MENMRVFFEQRQDYEICDCCGRDRPLMIISSSCGKCFTTAICEVCISINFKILNFKKSFEVDFYSPTFADDQRKKLLEFLYDKNTRPLLQSLYDTGVPIPLSNRVESSEEQETKLLSFLSGALD